MFARLYPIDRIASALVIVAIGIWSTHALDGNREPFAGSTKSAGSVVRSSRLLMGTIFQLAVWAPHGSEPDAATAIQTAFDRIATLESVISNWQLESETTALNRASGRTAVQISDELSELLDLSLQWSKRTDGAFDITVGPLLDRWRRARVERLLPTDAEIAECLARVNYHQVVIDGHEARLTESGMSIDLGAIGKGYAADLAGDQLRKAGFENFIIDAGGDLVVSGNRGTASWEVAIQHPRRSTFLASCNPQDCAVATSGDYEQFTTIGDVRYSHIVDPRTGWPVRDVASVTVIARRAVDADALATALSVMGPDAGMALIEGIDGTQALFVLASGEVRLSSGLRLEEDRLVITSGSSTLTTVDEE
jgi:thiamine biosynthesis lipoprotein